MGVPLHTPELVAAILVDWRAGHSYGRMSKRYELSKNMIAGIVGRNKNPDEESARPFRDVSATRSEARLRPELPSPRESFHDHRPNWMLSHRMSSGARYRECQWIAGVPSADDACKCRAATGASRVYCPKHERRAWGPARNAARAA